MFPRKKALWGLLFFLLAAGSRGQTPYDEQYVQGHRCLVVDPGGLPDDAPLVLILHGFGTNGDDMVDLTQELTLPPCLFVLPDGPFRAARGGRAWYGEFTHSYKDMEQSRKYLFAVIERFSKVAADNSKPGKTPTRRPLLIMGFSQGAKMALQTGINYPGSLLAIVSMSGFIEYPEQVLAHPKAAKKTPILLVRGQWDPVIQEEEVQSTMGALRRAGYRPQLREFEMGHVLGGRTKRAVSEFLQKILPNGS